MKDEQQSKPLQEKILELKNKGVEMDAFDEAVLRIIYQYNKGISFSRLKTLALDEWLNQANSSFEKRLKKFKENEVIVESEIEKRFNVFKKKED